MKKKVFREKYYGKEDAEVTIENKGIDFKVDPVEVKEEKTAKKGTKKTAKKGTKKTAKKGK